jgi:hypothetical protein
MHEREHVDLLAYGVDQQADLLDRPEKTIQWADHLVADPLHALGPQRGCMPICPK